MVARVRSSQDAAAAWALLGGVRTTPREGQWLRLEAEPSARAIRTRYPLSTR